MLPSQHPCHAIPMRLAPEPDRAASLASLEVLRLATLKSPPSAASASMDRKMSEASAGAAFPAASISAPNVAQPPKASAGAGGTAASGPPPLSKSVTHAAAAWEDGGRRGSSCRNGAGLALGSAQPTALEPAPARSAPARAARGPSGTTKPDAGAGGAANPAGLDGCRACCCSDVLFLLLLASMEAKEGRRLLGWEEDVLPDARARASGAGASTSVLHALAALIPCST